MSTNSEEEYHLAESRAEELIALICPPEDQRETWKRDMTDCLFRATFIRLDNFDLPNHAAIQRLYRMGLMAHPEADSREVFWQAVRAACVVAAKRRERERHIQSLLQISAT